MVFFALVLPCIILFSGVYIQTEAAVGMLYPRDSESRESKLLDGIWHFRADMSPTRTKGFDEKWWKGSLLEVHLFFFLLVLYLCFVTHHSNPVTYSIQQYSPVSETESIKVKFICILYSSQYSVIQL